MSVDVWDEFLDWMIKNYPEVNVTEISCKRFKRLQLKYLHRDVVETSVNYCEFTKCRWGNARFDLGGCSIAWSGETCYTLYFPELGEPISDKSMAYEIHLEEVRLNNE